MTEREKTLDHYNQQQEFVNKREDESKKPPIFFRNRAFMIFKGNYFIVLLSLILLIINTVLRIFAETYWYILPNIIFLIIFLTTLSVVEPLDFSSDNKKYIFPKFNMLYQNAQKIAVPLLSRLGSNLKNKPQGSLYYSFILTLLGSLTGLLFYNSNFSILGLPFFLIFIARSFTSNKMKEQVGKITIFKWILFLVLLINSIVSVIWKTPFDYTLLIIISIYNTVGIWFKNTYVYTIEELGYVEE